MNKDRRTKFKRWFYGALLPCLSDRGKIRVVGTILHMDSLLENLMPSSQLQGKVGGFRHLVREDLKEYSDIKLPWRSVKYRAHTNDFKKMLWPEAKTVEFFKAKKEDFHRQGLDDVYSQEMLNIPLDVSNSFFRKEDFLKMEVDDHKRLLVHYVTCDLAVSTKERSDYSAFTVAGMDERGSIYLKHVIKDRMDTKDLVETMLSLQRIYKPVFFGIEQGVISKAIGPYLNEAMMNSGVYINLVQLRPSVDKITRAASMQARMRSGAVKFNKEADWYQPFEDELLKFPRDKHDDQVDSWSYMGLLLDKMYEAPTPQEVEEEEYSLMVRKHDTLEGRNKTCGY